MRGCMMDVPNCTQSVGTGVYTASVPRLTAGPASLPPRLRHLLAGCQDTLRLITAPLLALRASVTVAQVWWAETSQGHHVGPCSVAGAVAVRVQDYLAKAPTKRLEPIAGSVAGSNEASGGEVPHPADSGGSGLEALERNMTDLMRSNSDGPHPEDGTAAGRGPPPAGLHN